MPIVVPVGGRVGRFPLPGWGRCFGFGRRIHVVAVPIAVLVVGGGVGCMFTAAVVLSFFLVPFPAFGGQRRILVNPVGHARPRNPRNPRNPFARGRVR